MDEADLAQESIDFHLAHSLRQISNLKFEISQGPAVCEGCGGGIPEARRKAVPGCTRCVKCQEAAEGNSK